jgi:hypothetical protein
MNATTTAITPEILAQLAELQQLKAEKAAAEKAAREAEERKRIAAENGGYAPGTHPFGFPCLIDVNGDPESPYVKFRLTSPVVCLREPQESADGKTTWGAELLVMPANVILSWSAGGPKAPLSTGSYLSASGGSSSSKLTSAPADWMTKTQIGTLVRFTVNGSPETGIAWYIDGVEYPNKSVWLTDVNLLMVDWLESLSPATTGKRRTRR